MTTIGEKFGTGGANVAPGGSGGDPDLATTLREIADDLTALRTAFVTLTAKIDADAGDTGGDNDYAATCDPAALKTIKG